MEAKRIIQVAIVMAVMMTSWGVVEGFGRLCNKAPLEEDMSVHHMADPFNVPVNLKVAFIGDAGNGEQQALVLSQIKSFGAAFVLHQGDFEYDNDPQLFEDQVNAVLGPDYPYFASIGNHDNIAWNGHSQRLQARLDRIGATNVNCTGDVGVNMACTWNGIFFVLSGVGTRGSDHESYMDKAFLSSNAIWKVSSWHKNQRLMQIGGKFDETGWDVYDLSRVHGAIIATGHEHSYCRSYMMSDFENQVVANFDSTLTLKVGETFAFVSGLAGKDIRDWNPRLIENEWWAAYGASDNGILDGALLCTFNVNGDTRRAHCTFVDRSGKVWDDFDIVSSLTTDRKELAAQVAEAKAKMASSCRTKWIEVPISRSNGDALENAETGEVDCKARLLSFADKATASLRFEGVPVKKGSRVRHAHLQVYGAEADNVDPTFVITALKNKKAAALKCGERASRFQLASQQVTSSFVAWEKEDEDWEIQNVWVSPDLKDVINEVISSEEWEEGDAITLRMWGQGNRSFHSFDDSPCFAPTLAIELEKDC